MSHQPTCDAEPPDIPLPGGGSTASLALCLLPLGHPGPHEWTPWHEITVSFAPLEEREDPQ